MHLQRHFFIAGSQPPACECGWTSGTTVREEDAQPTWFPHYLESLTPVHLQTMVARRIIVELTEAFETSQHFHWNTKDMKLMYLAWGWYVQANRTAHAVFVLFHNGHNTEAVPAFRSCFEHTLFLDALVRHGDSAVDAALANQARSTENLIQTMKSGPMARRFPQTMAAADAAPAAVAPAALDAIWTQQVWAICERYGATGSLYALYRLICQYTHPTIRSATMYLDEEQDLDAPRVFLRRAQFTIESDILFWTAAFLVWAGQAFSKLLVQADFVEILDRAATELGILDIDKFAAADDGFGATDLTPERLDSLLFGEGSQATL